MRIILIILIVSLLLIAGCSKTIDNNQDVKKEDIIYEKDKLINDAANTDDLDKAIQELSIVE